MIYYHYGSKQGLYLAILRDMFASVGARARAIADGDGTAADKMDAWIAAVVGEAAARPWFPPVMLREVAGGATHFDPDTFALMDGIYAAVRDIIAAGQRQGEFGQSDPLLTHMTIMPAILIFFARQRVIAANKVTQGVATPRSIDAFVRHMQRTARRMLGKDARS
jgi:AcrR family transcriptional regulator